MPKQSLYEGAVLVHPENPDEEDTELAVEPTSLLATSQDAAETKLTRKVPQGYDGTEDRWEVVVRPM